MTSNPKQYDPKAGEERVPGGGPDEFGMGADDTGKIITMTEEEARRRYREIAAEEAEGDE